jgi:hypothetical protein
MKTYIKTGFLIFALWVTAVLVGCSDIYDNVKEYSVHEIVYPAKFAYIDFNYGLERVEFELNRDGRVPASEMKLGKAKKTVVEYDGKRIVIDSVCSWVGISGLNESRLYRFKIYTEDEYGNRSTPQEIALTPYTMNDVHALMLVPPSVTESVGAALLEWRDPIKSDLYELFSYKYNYTDKNGDKNGGEGDDNKPVLFVENVINGEEVSIDITARIVPYVGVKPLIDTIEWNTSYMLRLSEDASPAIFLKTPVNTEVISIPDGQFPILFEWVKLDFVDNYILKASRSQQFPEDATVKIELGDVNSYAMTREDVLALFPNYIETELSTTFYWTVEPKDKSVPVRLQTRNLNYHRYEPIYLKQLNMLHDLNGASSVSVSQAVDSKGQTIQVLSPSGNDPYIYLGSIGEVITEHPEYWKIYAVFEYQTNYESTTGQFFWGKPNAAGGVSTGTNLIFPTLGYDLNDESKWVTTKFDCANALQQHNWGSGADHRIRFDYYDMQGGGTEPTGVKVAIRQTYIEILTQRDYAE